MLSCLHGELCGELHAAVDEGGGAGEQFGVLQLAIEQARHGTQAAVADQGHEISLEGVALSLAEIHRRMSAAFGVVPQSLAHDLPVGAGAGHQDGLHHVRRHDVAQADLAEQHHSVLQAAHRMGRAIGDAAGDAHHFAHQHRIALDEVGQLGAAELVVLHRTHQLRQHSGHAGQAAHVEAAVFALVLQALENGLFPRLVGSVVGIDRLVEDEAEEAFGEFVARHRVLWHRGVGVHRFGRRRARRCWFCCALTSEYSPPVPHHRAASSPVWPPLRWVYRQPSGNM